MTLGETQFEGGRQRAFRAHVLGQLVHRREEGADAVGQARRHTGAGPHGGTPGSPRPTPAGCCCRARLSNSPGSAPQSSFRRPPRNNHPTGNQHLRHHQRLLMALSWALHSAAALSADSLLCLRRPGLLGGEWQALGGGVGGGGSEEQAGPALCRLCTGGGGTSHIPRRSRPPPTQQRRGFCSVVCYSLWASNDVKSKSLAGGPLPRHHHRLNNSFRTSSGPH